MLNPPVFSQAFSCLQISTLAITDYHHLSSYLHHTYWSYLNCGGERGNLTVLSASLTFILQLYVALCHSSPVRAASVQLNIPLDKHSWFKTFKCLGDLNFDLLQYIFQQVYGNPIIFEGKPGMLFVCVF